MNQTEAISNIRIQNFQETEGLTKRDGKKPLLSYKLILFARGKPILSPKTDFELSDDILHNELDCSTRFDLSEYFCFGPFCLVLGGCEDECRS